MPSTSDFLKKLYKVLEDHSFSRVVSWARWRLFFCKDFLDLANARSPLCQDMNEFTKCILPRMSIFRLCLFSLGNCTSMTFTRALRPSLYPCMLADISLAHQVKNADDVQFSEHS
ncbi:hypothetical protein SCLCIDRAFT_250686 [Scleroderma citrinum Foug A]|uniref:Uncharacterized protein n=1 Tax=Scleroderma citrinum Foug A TaxID=1036808 RepID=A0A0C3DIQ5_9AGAM|nr:hypothetical protein SCLCIDRAFT_250686 [Scleroderma citrinum Foug A]